MSRLAASSCLVAVVAVSACAPGPECSSTSDCGFGSTCQAEQCVAVGAFGIGGVGAVGADGSSRDWRSFRTSATLAGYIGAAPVDSAVGDVQVDTFSDSVTVTVFAADRSSTFVLLAGLTEAALQQPGLLEISGDSLTDTIYSIACNYDDGFTYDEYLSDIEVDVGSARPPRDGEVEVAVPEVVDIRVHVVGEGSDVVATAVVPAAW